ncbi:similar to glucose-6-phosphate/phosphate-translocator precursor [Chondrus crispus]|uniref:Similar to glucose-6-phosphate/phosphate-translocator n=1 Tax=Chondrus crispus TaxID=2769 RepID=R7Q7X8_CHOCR|nr:similar to glucose-6-phosphate/phosphate-translocator precursor [Chondrus crispus]CDF34134.1 similar to glucose-6-phosphate/phosphate-translocator precursor [Chondrus crispus]|eukprot:XP_005713953.1 similar to glucose-6-phosphate/phosphate-translocator precursor [Chondrus crispus]
MPVAFIPALLPRPLAARPAASLSPAPPSALHLRSTFLPARPNYSASPPLLPRISSTPFRLSASASDVSAPVPAPVPAPEKKTSTLKVGFYIFLWYAFNIVYNISNKKVLNWFPLPWFVSWFQLLVGVLYVLPLWGLRLRKAPVVPKEALKTLLPISVGHVIGHVSTVVSLGAVAVSFTHVVKSMEPFVNVVGSGVFLQSFFPLPVYLSLLPVVAGVVMASVSEVSFTWLGFLSAMTSNFAFTARNIFSKLSMNKPKGENMGPANLFAVLSVMSTLLLAPVALIIDHPAKLIAAWKKATVGATAVVAAPKLIAGLLISGLFFYLYQEVAFKALDSVHPITHAVANTVKRVVIIVTSVFVFQNPVTKANAMGSAIALLGVLLYSVMKNYFPELPKKQKQA